MRWDAAPRYVNGEERSLDGGLRYSIGGGSYEAFRDEFLWVAGKEGERPAVLTVRLHDLRAEDYETSPMARLQPDSGINVFGVETATGPASLFIGLGPEPAAQQFRAALKGALDS